MTAKTLFAVKPTLFILVLMVSVGPFWRYDLCPISTKLKCSIQNALSQRSINDYFLFIWVFCRTNITRAIL